MTAKMGSEHVFEGHFSRFTEFEDEAEMSEDHPGEVEEAGGTVMRRDSSHLLMMALLEHLCALYVSDPLQADQLFKIVWSRLAGLKITSPLITMDEMESLRGHMRTEFTRLIEGSINQITPPLTVVSQRTANDRAQLFFMPRVGSGVPSLHLSDLMDLHTSRYTQEYEELGCLGRGAYGSVYKVRNKLDGSTYAIKKIPFQYNTPELWVKTLREVKHLASLSHPNVVGYHNSWLEYEWNFSKHKALPPRHDDSISINGTNDSIIFQDSDSPPAPKVARQISLPETSRAIVRGHHYNSMHHYDQGDFSMRTSPSDSRVVLHIQMALCQSTLHSWIQDRNRHCGPSDVCSVDEVKNLHFLREILQGVEYIHSQDLIHRDIKPKNIFLQENGEGLPTIKIGDFGLTRTSTSELHRQQSQEEPLTPHPGLTGFDGVPFPSVLTSGVGTTIYASPEQLEGRLYNKTSDIFSLGLIIFELYHPMCTEMERVHVLHRVRKGEIPSEFCDKWPQITKYLRMMIDVDSEARPSATELLACDLFPSKDQVIASLRSTILEKDTHIQDLEKKLADNLQKDSYIRDLERKIAELQLKLSSQ